MTQLDTLAFAKRLREAGVPNAQAEAHAEAAHDFFTGTLATKTDVVDLKAAIRADIADLKQAIKTDVARIDTTIAEIRGEIALSKWMAATALVLGLANIGICVTILTKLPHP